MNVPPPPGDDVVHVAARIARTEAEGPGLRFALWVQGCPLRCEGCCNPAMLPFTGGSRMTVAELLGEVAAAEGVEGVTILGGEPFAQAGALAAFARAVRRRGLTVMAFSGYRLEELRSLNDASTKAMLGAIDLLVDGRFERGNPSAIPSVGSANQRLHALTSRGSDLARRLRAGPDVVEVRIDGDRVLVNGSPDELGCIERVWDARESNPEPTA